MTNDKGQPPPVKFIYAHLLKHILSILDMETGFDHHRYENHTGIEV
ncbi:MULTISPECIES: hypothetical protein [unclassified Nodularia (in: cyanobacteria)]|nr:MULTISPECIES: hypothetical protein [unclassified Nodularia (in: cyanobacteria)]MBE9201672.1 hypothetical protein [Nodularia sp. LEGE 06071]